MKFISLIAALLLVSISCEKEDFDIYNPNVEIFVNQLKLDTYRQHEKTETGENLWLIMPKFNQSHIRDLIAFSKDTSTLKISL